MENSDKGKPWQNVGIYKSYEEASNRLMHLIAESPTYNFKIKRSGPNGSQFIIKKRLDPEMSKIEKDLKSKAKTSKQKKNKK